VKDIRQGTCPLCEGQDIIEAEPLDFTASDNTASTPVAVTHMLSSVLRVPDQHQPRGLIRLYVCSACGYCQTFALDPASIPVGPEFKTRRLPRSGPPYR
jgi:hypothetical protein